MRASIVPVVVASVSLTVLSGIVPVSVAHGAPECLAKPGAPPPQGKHWYYNTDRINKRRCWYLGPEGRRARPDATRVASPESQPAARPQPAPAKPQRTIEAIVRDLNAEGPARATVGEGSPVGLSARESDQPAAQGAIDGVSTSAREPVSNEPAKTDSEVAGTPPVWPVLPAAEPAATQPSATVEPPPAPPAPVAAATPQPLAASEQPAATTEQPAAAAGTSWSLVFLAGMFVLAGFVGRAVYKRTAGQRFDRQHGLDRTRVTPAAMAPAPSLSSTFATEVGHWTDIARRQPLPTDRFDETEDAVRALMRASRASRHEHAA
jgi:hypothetical protein